MGTPSVLIWTASEAGRSGAVFATAVDRISLQRLVEHGLETLLATPCGGLAKSATCPLLWSRVQIDFQTRVWNDHGANIAADHHDRAAGRNRPLQRQQSAAHRRMLGDPRDGGADLRITHRPGDVLAVQPDIVETAVTE